MMANFDFDCADVNGIRFSDADVVNPDDFVPDGDYNPHRVRPWLFHDAGFVLGIVFASNLSDAFDELADGEKIEHLKVEFSEEPESEFQSDYDGDEERLSCLGNHGEMYDTENVCFVEMRNPRFSFTALFVADEREPDERESIIRGMARAMFVNELADTVDRMRAENHRDAPRLPHPGPGGEWYDVAPFDRMPSAYYGWADSLALSVEKANDGKSLPDLRTERESAGDDDAETFGHYIVMSALGHGVGVSTEYQDGDKVRIPYQDGPMFVREDNAFLFRENV